MSDDEADDRKRREASVIREFLEAAELDDPTGYADAEQKVLRAAVAKSAAEVRADIEEYRRLLSADPDVLSPADAHKVRWLGLMFVLASARGFL